MCLGHKWFSYDQHMGRLHSSGVTEDLAPLSKYYWGTAVVMSNKNKPFYREYNNNVNEPRADTGWGVQLTIGGLLENKCASVERYSTMTMMMIIIMDNGHWCTWIPDVYESVMHNDHWWTWIICHYFICACWLMWLLMTVLFSVVTHPLIIYVFYI